MTTILDTLIVKLRLDRGDFDKSGDEAKRALDKTAEAAKKTGDQIERSGKGSATAIKAVTREVMTLFAVLIGGRGVKEFVSDISRAENELGKMAVTAKMAPGAMSAWGQAIERIGGNAGEAAQSIGSLTRAIAAIKTGDASIIEPLMKLQGAGGHRINPFADTNTILRQVTANISSVWKRDPALAMVMGQKVGLSPNMVQLMAKGWGEVSEMLRRAKENAPSQKDIDASNKLIDSWAKLHQTGTSLGRAIKTDLSPEISAATDGMNAWTRANKGWIESEVVKNFRALAGVLKSIVGYLRQAIDMVNEFGKITGLTWLLGRFMGFKDSELDTPRGGVAGQSAGRWLGSPLSPGGPSYTPDRNTGIGGMIRRGWNWLKSPLSPTPGGSTAAPPAGRQSGAMNRYRGLSSNQKSEMAAAIRETAAKIGARPEELAAVMSFETGGTLNPHKSGGDGGAYTGLIQWSPSNIRKYFGSREAFNRATIKQQVEAAGQYLQDRGYQPGMPLEGLYSAVLAGRAGERYWDRTDSNGTSPRSGAAAMRRSAHINALAALERGAGGGLGIVGTAHAADAGRRALPQVSPYNPFLNGGSFGAPFAAGAASRVSHISNSNKTQIGTVMINTMATDASGIARDMGAALGDNSYAGMADAGMD